MAAAVENAPAVWFKFRAGDKLTETDREIVVVIRKLAHFMDQLERLTQTRAVGWKVLFEVIRREVDKQASPVEQGRAAARILRAERQFGYPGAKLLGITGTGDIIRGNLRALGVRVVETPLQHSQLEGCSFYVGAPGEEKPCIFANTYKQTWFRRNVVLMHELAHAIFDIDTNAASVDFTGEGERRQLEELRAQAFAQEALIPREVLAHIGATQGLRWESLSARDLATLVAYSQVEQRTVVRASVDANLVPAELAEAYCRYEIHDELQALTDRALSTREFIEKAQIDRTAIIPAEDRTTTIPSRALRLPLPYVARVIELAQGQLISIGKAAQMLMVDRDTFDRRFGRFVREATA